jgi:hypothetical protein
VVCVLSDPLVYYIIDISFNYICVTYLYGLKNLSATTCQDRVVEIVDLRNKTLNHKYD